MSDPLSKATKGLREPEPQPESQEESAHVAVDISEMAKWVELYRKTQAKMSELEDLKKMAKEKITALLEAEGADEGKIDGKTVVTWYTQTRRDFDSKKFRVKYPELADEYTKVSTRRTFLPKDA